MPIVKWIVTIGAVFAMSSCLMGSIFSLPRILYSMGCDGVIFHGLSSVNLKTKTPLWAILIISTIASSSQFVYIFNFYFLLKINVLSQSTQCKVFLRCFLIWTN